MICFFYGVFVFAMGVLSLYWLVDGTPSAVEAKLPAQLVEDSSTLAFLGAGFVIFGIIFIVIGIFAYAGRVSAMVVGSLFWIVASGMKLLNSGSLGTFEIAHLLVFVALTAIAAIAGRRGATVSHHPT